MQSITPDEVKEMLKYIEARPDYDKWIKIISAVGNSFDHNTALDILLSRFRDEKPKEHEIKLKNRLSHITLATLIYYAKQNGYKRTLLRTNPVRTNNLKLTRIRENQPQPVKFIDIKKDFYYRFDDNTEERIAIMTYQQGLSRFEAERIVMRQTPELPKERAYRIAINEKVKNKTTDYKTLNSNFKNRVLTIKEIADHIGKGFSFIGAEFKTDEKQNIIRNNANWLCSELITLDIDNGLSLEDAFNIEQTEHALLVYTTPSHTPEKHRFRILFDLPYLETNQERYREILKSFIKIYKADEQCKDLARLFFGNTNATIYLIRTGEILTYKNGVCLNEQKTT